ncbi:hypothetical protein N1851_017342 [Merluccius polli]|uniref:Uncharacterized protein n=1 Tax=Merluccius polli TaxID=89951 RepID=A0AA47P1C8_MERPO|nr:hypothetical protein N1851_017342 [Merluccius polli]
MASTGEMTVLVLQLLGPRLSLSPSNPLRHIPPRQALLLGTRFRKSSPSRTPSIRLHGSQETGAKSRALRKTPAESGAFYATQCDGKRSPNISHGVISFLCKHTEDSPRDTVECLLQVHKTHVDWLGKLPCTLKDPAEGVELLEHTLQSPFLKRGNTTPVCQSRGTAPDVHAMLQSRVNHDSPTTSRALPPRSFLTTLATSAPEIGEPTPESPGPASLPEGVSVGLRRSSKYSFHQSTTSRDEVSSTPSPPYTVLTMHCFPLLRCRIVVQNLFEAVQKSFSMASPNSSHVRIFASATTAAALRLACRYLPAASGVPQAKKILQDSFFSLTASITAGVHQRVR